MGLDRYDVVRARIVCAPCSCIADDKGMWKGLKKVLGKPGKAKKCSLDRYALDSSTRSTSSAAHGSIVFPLDLGDEDALTAWVEQHQRAEQEQQQLPRLRSESAGPDPLTASQLQQQLQQQLVVQQLAGRTDDYSTSKRQAAALQKRIDNQMLNPATCLYQISSLLSLSTLFEHKVSRVYLRNVVSRLCVVAMTGNFCWYACL